MRWMTNDPAVARELNSAELAYSKAREAASTLPLAEKIVALREAKEALYRAYETARTKGY